MNMHRPFRSWLLGLLIVGGVGACTSPPSTRTDSSDVERVTIRDLTRTAESAPHESVPERASIRAIVPWDSTAILDVATADDHPDVPAGALIVRYGKRWSMDDGIFSTLYVLAADGAEIEPIALQWHPPGGTELRAIARVDGVLRRWDFDR